MATPLSFGPASRNFEPVRLKPTHSNRCPGPGRGAGWSDMANFWGGGPWRKWVKMRCLVLGSLRKTLGLWVLCSVACTGGKPEFSPRPSPQGMGGTQPTCEVDLRAQLRINELVSRNDGVAIDETGATEDYVELVSVGQHEVDLSQYRLSDSGSSGTLPDQVLQPGERILLWADGESTSAAHHLPFRLSGDGEKVTLRRCGQIEDELKLPALEPNESYARFPDKEGAFAVCRFASPNRDNGPSCEPPELPAPPDDQQFAPYDWDLPYPSVPTPLALSELLLRPSEFVELVNTSSEPVSLGAFSLRVAPTTPGQRWPGVSDGVALSLPQEDLQPGAYRSVAVPTEATSSLLEREEFEGVVTLSDANGAVVDRVDFMRWPEDASLARIPEYPGRHVFCQPATPDEANDSCQILASRPVGDRVRHLRTLNDFAALAEGGNKLGIASVEFVDDLASGNVIHLLSARAWSLHFEFIRETIEGHTPLDRCDPTERAIFNRGWSTFSVNEYFRETGRHYLLGTLVHHASTDLHTVEFALGDVIRASDMREAFFQVTRHVLQPELYGVRPQDESQSARALTVEGTLPIVSASAPFRDVELQPLTNGVGYGVLTFVEADELHQATLGYDVIVVTDAVPNDIPTIGGLITEAFQTPLAHVNLLSQSRGTPNLALPDARHHPEVEPYLGELVRFEVRGDGFEIRLAEPEEAQTFWESRLPTGPRLTPRLDTGTKELVELADASLADLPRIGAKAAQLAELYSLASAEPPVCNDLGGFAVPSRGFAVPVVHFVDHFRDSGAAELLSEMLDDPDVLAHVERRHQRLDGIRQTILARPVNEGLTERLKAAIADRWGTRPVRLRSSSNVEDLSNFNGAGLYTSVSVDPSDPQATVENGIRTVWASLFADRAFDERELLRIDQTQVAMGVLVHEAFPIERANGVVISRDVLDPNRGDIYYFNVQAGEASVTNPAPGVTTEQFIYRLPPRTPPVSYSSLSSLIAPETVLSLEETERVACSVSAIVDHFVPLLDPERENPYFAMDVEFKLLGEDRRLLLKQARPYVFGSSIDIGDCRQL